MARSHSDYAEAVPRTLSQLGASLVGSSPSESHGAGPNSKIPPRARQGLHWASRRLAGARKAKPCGAKPSRGLTPAAGTARGEWRPIPSGPRAAEARSCCLCTERGRSLRGPTGARAAPMRAPAETGTRRARDVANTKPASGGNCGGAERRPRRCQNRWVGSDGERRSVGA
jgi:hypothetical protein